MSSKKKVAEKRTTLGEQLVSMGWKCTASISSGSDNYRPVYRNGINQILLPSANQPSVTLQRLDSATVNWFVDFPLCVELSAILIFAGAA